MKKLIGTLLSLAMLASGIAGCSNAAEPSATADTQPATQAATTETTEAAAPAESAEGTEAAPSSIGPVTFTVLTLSSGTGSYAETVAYTNLLNSKHADWKVFMQSVASSGAIPSAVQNGEAEVGHSVYTKAAAAYRGTDEYTEAHTDLRVLAVAEDMAWSYLTYEGTGIESIEDLRGKKLGNDFGVTSTMNTMNSRLVLEAYGIDPDKDVTAVPQESMTQPITDLLDRAIDAGYVSLNGSKIAELAATYKPVILPISEEAALKVKESSPLIFPGVTMGDTEGVPAGIPVLTSPTLVYSHASLSDEVAYEIVKTIVENTDELVAMNPVFAFWSNVKPIDLPYHPGAIQYFKDAGLWTEEMEQDQAQFS